MLSERPKSKKPKARLDGMISQIYQKIIDEHANIVVVEDEVVGENIHATVVLSKIIGAIIGKCIELNIPYLCYAPSQWRSKHGIQDSKAKRQELKRMAIDKVKEIYNSDVSDDEAEAILIGAAWYL